MKVTGNDGTPTELNGTVVYNDKTYSVVSIQGGYASSGGAFRNCSSLQSIGDLSACTIGNYAFYGCSSLQSIGDLSACTFGEGAFYGCSSLQSVDLSACTSIGNSAFYDCGLQTIGDLSACTTIGQSAFSQCSSLQSVGDLPVCTSIGNQVFYRCTSLQSIGDLSACTSIGSEAFYQCGNLQSIGNGNLSACTNFSAGLGGCYKITSLTFGPTVPSSGQNIPSFITVYVPAASLEDYRNAWTNTKTRVLAIGTTTDYNITVTAQESSSDVIAKIGEENLGKVVTLKVTGTINGYDIMAMRNKMVNLHHLDLSDASIVANPYEYYTGCHTEDNVLGQNSFSNLYLVSVKLPRTLTKVENAFYRCRCLKQVEMYEGIKEIGQNAFNCCQSLATINFPDGIERIGEGAFCNCDNLISVDLPHGLKVIDSGAFLCEMESDTKISHGSNLTYVSFPNTLLTINGYYNGATRGAFANCSKLTSINLPNSLTTIGRDAFRGCFSLTEAKIPASITSIGDNAFNGCSALNDIYTWTVEPVSIGQNTFSTWTTATIHTPATSHDNYFYNTQWSQFLTQVDFDEPYEYFYINNDYTLDDATNGRIDGTPDADFNEGSGFIVEGNTDQDLGNVTVHDNGNGTGASIIGDGNINANSLIFDITIQGGKWHFFCFPFDILLTDIVGPSNNWVFRRYDGDERGRFGQGGWKNLPVEETCLHAGQGYIFQCNKNGTLRLTVRPAAFGTFASTNINSSMATYTSANAENASWNFIGNPYLCYYDMDDLGYNAPITRWNGSAYVAIRPGDDDYIFHPFEAFFVQKPEGVGSVNFNGNCRITYQQSQAIAHSKAFSRKVNPDRMLVNLEISDGATSDKTRVVFNNKQSMDYEIGCDAAKFLSNDAPQIYTLDRKQVKYAINERPIEDGSVALGFSVTKAGQYEIAATRMDCPMLLLDQKLGTTFDLSLGSYTFTAEAGSNSDRFVLLKDSNVTGVSDLMAQTGVSVMPVDGGLNIKGADGQTVNVYTVAGVRVANGLTDGYTALQGGTYIVKVGNKSAKVLVR